MTNKNLEKGAAPSLQEQLLAEASAPQQDPVAQQHELLISEIESTDGHLGTALRSVYEGAEPEKFLERLDSRIKGHNKEIERMCNHHYQGFIESVHSLLQVRGDVDKLKNEIHVTNRDLQLSGQKVVSRAEELVRQRKIQQNIESAVETLTICLPVLEMYGKLRDQMASKRYYPALKTLEQLEHTYLPRVSKYRFSKAMCETIPRMRDNIKESSMSDLKDFLESIRKHSALIGERAMRQTAQENGLDPTLASLTGKKRLAPQPPGGIPNGTSATKQNGIVDRHQVAEVLAGKLRKNPFDDDAETPDNEDSTSAQDLIDFAPIYRCLHIYSVLGTKDTFESYYRKQRRKQARLALQPPPSMDKRSPQLQLPEPTPHETLEGYKSYFYDIVGFFVVEDRILSTTSGLINQVYLDELWDTALSRIVAVLRTHIGYCTDTALLLQVKNLIMLFCLTLRGYGFSVSQLYELLLGVRDQYSEILRKRWVGVFNKIFEEDNYTPITVESEEEYQRIISTYPFTDPKLEQAQFPKRFPFSQFVPRVYSEVKEYIHACLKFSEDLHLSETERVEMIQVAASNIMQHTLKNCISSLIQQPRLALVQLIQISINMEHLDQSCAYLEDFITSITGARQDKLYTSKLTGQSMFKSAKSDAEGEIYRQINIKIEEFFELAEYDWLMGSCNEEPSGYVTDMISFLRGTFSSFTNLPDKVAQTACMSACKHMARLMMDFLVDEEIKSISTALLKQFSRDVEECEDFAEKNPIHGLDGKTFKLAFADLRQLLNLFLDWDWANYFADFGKDQSRFVRVNPATCILLLEKLKEGDKKKGTNLLNAFKKDERDKKKLLDTVLKQLRFLVNEQHMSQFN